MSIFVSHVPFMRLVDLVEGRVPGDERAQIMSHIDTCQHCSAEVARVEHLIELMRSDLSEDAPALVIARAVHLFRSPRIAVAPNLLQRVVAILRFDSAQLSSALGVRTVSEGQPAGARQLLYSTADHELDVRITPMGDAWIVAGQVLSPVVGGQVELQGTAGALHTSLNDLSEFILPPTAAGLYKLIVHLTDLDVEVAGLIVGG